MPRFHAAMAAALTFALAQPALAEDLATYEAANDAAIAAWTAMPLTFESTTLITQPADGYGVYEPRDGSEFAPGEPIIVYTEPMGFGWQENDDGTYSFGLQIDLVLKNAEGQVLGGQEEFQRYLMTSRERNREFFISLTLDLSNAPNGAYVVDYIVHDLAEEQSATLSLPFSISGE